MERWLRKWYSGGTQCTGLERTTEQKNISLAEAQGAFYILAIGFVLAVLLLVGEKVLVWSCPVRDQPSTVADASHKEQQTQTSMSLLAALAFCFRGKPRKCKARTRSTHSTGTTRQQRAYTMRLSDMIATINGSQNGTVPSDKPADAPHSSADIPPTVVNGLKKWKADVTKNSDKETGERLTF